MSNLVFISGDFCSGSTLLFTLFKKTDEFHCLYEPLHEKLLEYLIWPLRPYEHHFFVDDYFSEFRSFSEIPKLFKPRWGANDLYLPPDAEAKDLFRYLSYIIESSFKRKEKVMLQFNRATFRLGWLKAKFPHAKIVHIYRNKNDQWNSIVRRVQADHGKEEVGQDSVMFYGFNMAGWCEDLKSTYPELDKKNFKNGFDRFSKLWEMSLAENKRYADISVDYKDLIRDYENTFNKIGNCIGHGFDTEYLKKFIIPPEKQSKLSMKPAGLRMRILGVINKTGRKYARIRVRAEAFLRGKPL